MKNKTKLNKEEKDLVYSALNSALCVEHRAKKAGEYNNCEELYTERVDKLRTVQKKLNEMGACS